MKPEIKILYFEMYPFITAIFSLMMSQVIKSLYFFAKEKTIDFKKLHTAGGMPSSHSAMVASLTTAIGITEGWNSNLFCVCIIFSFVVLYDATGVRKAVGQQAVIMNQIMSDVFRGEFKHEKLTELLGHTPLEVLFGVLLGIIMAFILAA